MIRLFAAGGRGEQFVADRADIEFVQMSAVARCDERDQPIAGQTNFGTAIEVVIVRRELNPSLVTFGQATMCSRIEQIVGGNQVLVDGVAEVRQVRAAESAVPVAAIALASVKFGACLVY